MEELRGLHAADLTGDVQWRCEVLTYATERMAASQLLRFARTGTGEKRVDGPMQNEDTGHWQVFVWRHK